MGPQVKTFKWDPKYENILDNIWDPKEILQNENLGCITKTEWDQNKIV